jgi:hypothetical protein
MRWVVETIILFDLYSSSSSDGCREPRNSKQDLMSEASLN